MDIKVALKNALGTIQSPTTAANYQATDLVPLFDSNDQLIGKISRNELMSAVKNSLGTLLNQGAADLGTSLAKIPALNSGGTLGSATVANLASVLGGVFTGEWWNGTFETMALQSKQCCYYVDKDHNGGKRDFPYDYCIVSISYTKGSGGNDAVIAHAFNVVTGEVSMKVVQGFGSTRDYPWRDIPIGLPSFYKNYNELAALANAVGVSIDSTKPVSFALAPNEQSQSFSGRGFWSIAETANKGASALFSVTFDANGVEIVSDTQNIFQSYVQITKAVGVYTFTVTNKNSTKTATFTLKKIG